MGEDEVRRYQQHLQEVHRFYKQHRPALELIQVSIEYPLAFYTTAEPFEVDGIRYEPPRKGNRKPMLMIKRDEYLSYQGERMPSYADYLRGPQE